MPTRAPSPALSEKEVDITGGLVGDDSDWESLDGDGSSATPKKKDAVIPELNDGSDDEDFIAMAQAKSNRKTSNIKGRSVKKGGGFQAMGLNANLLKAITRKGFSVPTPIQRKAVPLVMAGQDVVGMARTGSGKTAAFVIPMIEKLKAHSVKVGARSLIMSPSRELALQTLTVVKELGKGTDLRCVLLVGGDSLEEQFSAMASNPDIVIATPGRFLHLKVEMGLDLSSMQYVVFDEADRLFEMGFAPQLHEILHALPEGRQTLLFSATLPSTLVDFAKAGLQEPRLIRLDTEGKISPDLQNAFFSVKSADKEGALLHIIHDIIQIPTGPTETFIKAKAAKEKAAKSKKRKLGEFEGFNPKRSPTEHSTIVFTATKHHVDYIATLLRTAGFAVSHCYGSLDQTARKMQIQDFRSGMTHIMVVTDVAARGIDIPVLANVINYDFPAQPKIFVHRVGRTARAGQRGWSYSLVRDADAAYLLDLQLFLGKRLLLGREGVGKANYAEDVTVGALSRERVSSNAEWVGKVVEEDIDVSSLRDVAIKGGKLYQRTRGEASHQSAKRAKELTASKNWMEIHPLFNDDTNDMEMKRESMLARVSGFRPQETIFEIGKRGSLGQAGEVVKKNREKIEAKRKKKTLLDEITGVQTESTDMDVDTAAGHDEDSSGAEDDIVPEVSNYFSDASDDNEIALSGDHPVKRSKTSRDDSIFMSYKPAALNVYEDRAYSVHNASNTNGQSSFLTEARSAAMDLNADEGGKGFDNATGAGGKRWDKRHKKYVSKANDEDGSKGTRLVRSESGAKIPASLKSGRFERWKKSNRVEKLPRVGEAEAKGNYTGGGGRGGGRYRHHKERAPKAPDKARDDYHKQRKKFESAKQERIGKFKDGEGRSEMRGVKDIQKDRRLKEKKREKSTRPGKRGKR